MYNAEIKKQYIEFNPNNNNQFDMLIVVNNQFLNYASWYHKRIGNKDNQNHYAEIRNDMLIKCVSYSAQKNKIITREDILELANTLINPYESFIFLALFEGLTLSDFEYLKFDNFNTKTKKVALLGRTLKISPELIHYAEDAADEYQIYNLEGKVVTRKKFVKGDDRIIKCAETTGFEIKDSKEERARIAYRSLQKLKKRKVVPSSISITSIIESGRICMIKELMKTHKINDVEQVLRTFTREISERYGHIPSVTTWLLKYESFCKL